MTETTTETETSSEAAPAIFITEPSGASEPYRIAVPPSAWIGSEKTRTTVPSGAGGETSARFSARSRESPTMIATPRVDTSTVSRTSRRTRSRKNSHSRTAATNGASV